MTDLENYSNIIDNIFGANTTTFKRTGNSTNNVIGALNNASNFEVFAANFTQRLRRLNAIYSPYSEYLQEILVKVNLITNNNNWEGAFAELACYDHLNKMILTGKDYLSIPIKPDITLNKSESFSLELGKEATNIDGVIEDYEIYFDIKSFKDNVDELLESIFIDFKKHLNNNEVHILGSYQMDISYTEIQDKRIALLNELKDKVTEGSQIKSLQSSIINGLSYQILWGGGINTAIRGFSPYGYAKNNYQLIFKYADKFLKHKPSLIVMVSLPWYNQILNNRIMDNSITYRALARRFFCQHIKDITKFNSLNPKFTGEQTVFEVSQYLSGILFLEDNAILSDKPNDTNVKGYLYLNPNAKHSLNRSIARHYLFSLVGINFEDFEDDNY